MIFFICGFKTFARVCKKNLHGKICISHNLIKIPWVIHEGRVDNFLNIKFLFCV